MRALTKEDLALIRGGGYGSYYYSLLSRYYGAVGEVEEATRDVAIDQALVDQYQEQAIEAAANCAADLLSADLEGYARDSVNLTIAEGNAAYYVNQLNYNEYAQYAWLIVEQNLAAQLDGYGH